MDFAKLTEVAQWLGKDIDAVKILTMKHLYLDKRYYVTIWGHYSAGKSRLINNILGRDILPVQSRETTAVLTYLQYGEKEECRVHYDDGTIVICEVEKVKEIFQNTASGSDLSKMDHIEVYINNEILQSGLILVDTPGVNTVLQKHQDLAVEAIGQSGKIVYVLGSSPSNVDKNFIHQIVACGIDIIFVRTKCDLFSETEENADTSLSKEQETLRGLSGKENTFIPVSNEKDSKWHCHIEDIRTELGKLAENMTAEMDKSIENKTRVYLDAYVKDLETEKIRLKSLIEGETDQIQEEIEKAQQNLKDLENLDRDLVSRIEDKTENEKRKAERDLNNIISGSMQSFEQRMNEIIYSVNASDEVRDCYNKCLRESVERMRKLLNSYFGNILQEEQESVKDLTARLNLEAEMPTYDEIQLDNSRVIEIYCDRLMMYKKELELIQTERQTLQEDGEAVADSIDDDEIEAELKRLNEALAQIPTDIALKISEDQGIRPSEVFRGIGQVADMALLLLPGDVIVQGISKAAEGAKIATKVAQGMNKAERAAKLAKNIDSVRDVAYMWNTVSKGRKYSTQKDREAVQKLVDHVAEGAGKAYDQYKEKREKGNVLDMLSVAFWTEKLGSCFDPPVKMEVDIALEEEKSRARNEITERQRALSEERIQKKKEHKLIQTRERELEECEKEKIRQLEQVELEMKQKEDAIRREAEKRAFERFKKSYSDYYENGLNEAKDFLMKDYFQRANQNIVMYVAGQNAELRGRIEEVRGQLDSLLKLRENGSIELQDRLSMCEQYLRELEMVLV